jgi:hypothetical protein
MFASTGFLLVALLSSSCLQDQDRDYIHDTAPVVSVEVLEAQYPNVRFLVSGAFPDTCWEHVGPRCSETGPHEYTVELETRAQRGVGCLTVLTPFEEEVTIAVPTEGDYRFVFPRKTGADPIVQIVTVTSSPN